MDLIYLLGMLVLLFTVASSVLLVIADCDIVTYFYSRFGKKPEEEFIGKVVWITGASSGIGEALAKELATIGAKLVLSARRAEELDRVKRECLNISKLTDKDILVLPLDVTKFDTHAPALNLLLGHFKKLDVLISNAGIPGKEEFVDTEMHVDRHIFEVNVFGVVNMNRLVVKYFMENGGGRIAVISSMAGRLPIPFSSTYAASKHAIHGYFNSLRMETYGKNIPVTIICPGAVATPIYLKVVTNKSTQPQQAADAKMPDMKIALSAEHCAHLSLVSIANQLDESLLAKFPFLPIVYIIIYFPLVTQVALKFLGGKILKSIKEM